MRKSPSTYMLDTLLETRISEEPRTIRDLRTLVEAYHVDAVPRIERSLQRLRRQNRVRLVGRLWAHPSVRECGSCEGRGWALTGTNTGASCTVCGGAGWIKSETVEGPVNADESK
jgi:hypothetical protein